MRFNRPSFVNLGRYSVTINRDGRMIFLMSEDLSLTPSLALTGVWEVRVVSVLRRLLRPGDLVVEGGANIGCHTLVMAKAIGPSGRLYAFEPLPDLFPLLQLNLGSTGRKHYAEVELRNLALLDHEGPIEMLLDPLFLGSGHLAIPHASHNYSRRISAQSTTIDAALTEEGTRPVSLIRLDIEGSEILALRGAEETISPLTSTQNRHGMVAHHAALPRRPDGRRGLAQQPRLSLLENRTVSLAKSSLGTSA